MLGLITADILAHQDEIAALSGLSLALQTSIFPFSGNIHGAVRQVQDWAGGDSYLVQQLPNQRIRAFRLTDPAAQNMLLIRLLPFTTSVARPLRGLELVYQSTWGGYLNIYKYTSAFDKSGDS